MVERRGFPSVEGYEILCELGQGGMATVYLARHLRLDRYEALKILNPILADDQEVAQRFIQEARISAALNHPHIVQTYCISSPGQHPPYIATQYIEGHDLQELLTIYGQMDGSDVLSVLNGPARALDYAHSLGVIHRDVKPGNILVKSIGPSRHGFLTDFGIAFSLSSMEGGRLTKVGSLLGTPAFMSPETVNGESALPQSDQYSLALVVYEALLGVGPFSLEEGATPARILVAQSVQPPLDPREREPSLPEGAACTLLRALSKNPCERFGSCTEFLDHMEASLIGWKPTAAFPQEPSFGNPQTRGDVAASGSTAPLTSLGDGSKEWLSGKFRDDTELKDSAETPQDFGLAGDIIDEASLSQQMIQGEEEASLHTKSQEPIEVRENKRVTGRTTSLIPTSGRRNQIALVPAIIGIFVGASFIAYSLGSAFAKPDGSSQPETPNVRQAIPSTRAQNKALSAPVAVKPAAEGATPASVKPKNSPRTRTTKKKRPTTTKKSPLPKHGSKEWQNELAKKDKAELEKAARIMGRERREAEAKRKR